MMVTVKFFANFREVTGQAQVTMPNVSSVRGLLDELVREFGQRLSDLLYDPQTGELRDTVIILVNGRAITLMEGLGTWLEDGDTVAIFPPVSGG
ncbi:MAG: MoaD/ThiS family protein [Actinomycetota bacterium]|nr:MoaD/ThiS family protein [Actinomycetota bacterium]